MSETSLTPAEQQYFDSAGEKVPDAAQATDPPDTGAQPAANDNENAQQAPTKTVPLAALHEERERRKELQRTVEQERQARATFEATINERLRLLGQVAQPQQPAVPEFAQDPQGHIDARIRVAEQTAAQAAQQMQLRQQQDAQQQAVQQVMAFGRQKAAEFTSKQADYQAAEQHLLTARRAQLQALGVPEAQIAQHVSNDVLQIAYRAMQTGTDPAEQIYNLAKTVGYQPKAAAANAENPLEAAQRGQQLATGIGSAGAAPAAKMTAERLGNMSPAEFQAFYDKHRAEADRLLDRG